MMTMEQFREDEQSVKDAILEDLQEMFGSDFIVGVSFSSVNSHYIRMLGGGGGWVKSYLKMR